MKLYMITERGTYARARKEGILQSSKEYWMFPKEYKWMIEQYNIRCNENVSSILWWWNCKIDITKGGYENGIYEILSAEVDNSKILGSNFDMWHLVLNNYDQHHWESMFDTEASKKYLEVKSFRKEDIQYVTKPIEFSKLELIKVLKV